MKSSQLDKFPQKSNSANGSFLPEGALVINASRIPGAGLGLFAGEGHYIPAFDCLRYRTGDMDLRVPRRQEEPNVGLRYRRISSGIKADIRGPCFCPLVGSGVGLIHIRKQLLRLEDRQYVMGTGHINCHIDATMHPKVFARYVNDNGNKCALNAEFVKFKQERRVLLRTTAKVLKGSEIYASYGEVFTRSLEHPTVSGPRRKCYV